VQRKKDEDVSHKAELHLGMKYSVRMGIPIDIEKGCHLWKSAADKGFQDAKIAPGCTSPGAFQ
jgi:hypothetical protein